MIRAGNSVLASIYSFIFSCFSEFLDLMQDSAVTSALSFNFLYVLICFWIVWQAVNMFIINPLPGGSLVNESVGSAVRCKVRKRREKAIEQARAERQARKSERSQRTYSQSNSAVNEG